MDFYARIFIINQLDATVNKLYQKLYYMFKTELLNLNIGYDYNRSSLEQMIDIINAIDLLKTQLPREESLKIIKLYE